MDDEPTFDLDAAGLRADGADVLVGVEVLARKLEAALPQDCIVERRSKRLFGGEKYVRAVTVTLGTARYGLAVDGHRVSAERQQEVRGVVIKREPLGLQEWLDALSAELREQAAGSARARAALERLVG